MKFPSNPDELASLRHRLSSAKRLMGWRVRPDPEANIEFGDLRRRTLSWRLKVTQALTVTASLLVFTGMVAWAQIRPVLLAAPFKRGVRAVS
jgi:hypothetical protein